MAVPIALRDGGMGMVADAEALAAMGKVEAGRQLLAAATDDVDALVALAGWYLVGTRLPRDVAAARALLQRAVAIGHVDAALLEVAFTANGSGGTPDWPAALRLLAIAAARDPLAAAQLALVRAMPIDATGRPAALPTRRRLSDRPEVWIVPGLFTPAECAHVAGVAADLLAPSDIVDPLTGIARPDPVRTSDGAVIGPAREDLVIRALNQRIAAASGTDIAQGEPLAVLRYRPGQQYRPHHDAVAGMTNPRGWTMLVYLNDRYHGGATFFEANKLTVQGRAGDGLLFRNLDARSGVDTMARHAGQPVTAGIKWLCTRWIRMGPHDPWIDR